MAIKSLQCQYMNMSTSDLLKGQIGDQSHTQKDGGYAAPKIRNHCQNLTVDFRDGVSDYILQPIK